MLVSADHRLLAFGLDDDSRCVVQALCAVCLRTSPVVRGGGAAVTTRLARLGWRVSAHGRRTCPVCASWNTGTYSLT